jgi:Arc/MetJ-type ribon-helix-helix transcriptional regulator
MTAVTLPEDLEAWARAQVAAGRADSVEALVADALRERRARLDRITAKLDAARESHAQGRSVPVEEVLDDLDAWILEEQAAAEAVRKAAE